MRYLYGILIVLTLFYILSLMEREYTGRESEVSDSGNRVSQLSPHLITILLSSVHAGRMSGCV